MFQSKKKQKERTLAYPHRIFNKVSIYLLKTVMSTAPNFTGYEAEITIDDLTFTFKSKEELTPKDGRIFDYVLSRIQAIGLSNTKLTFFTKELIQELGQTYRTENRKTIVQSLNKLTNVNISLLFGTESIQLSLLDSVTEVDGNIELEVILSQSFIDAMQKDVAKTRYINIHRTFKAKSQYTIELAKLLQMDGQGVNNNGEPISVKEINHERVVKYLSLDDKDTTVQINTLRKSFNELNTFGYKNYSYNGRKNSWQMQNKVIHILKLKLLHE